MNLQSEGHGISGFETMLSIGLGQEQQFTLILQTLQQLKDVYGDSVDKIVQGNTSNIVFLKSTDDAMLDTLQKMSGTTHKSYRTSKSITKDVQKLNMQNDGKATYTIQTSEVPVISYNDMAFISERNSIIFRAGDAPIWNRNETILPMSWRMFQNTIVQPGKKYSLQTIPTLSTAMDFDIRQNQPDFVKMLDKRMAQSVQAMKAAKQYQEAYGYTDAEIAKLDIDAYSDELMELVNAALAEQDAIIKEQQESMAMQRNDGKGSEETEPEYGEDGIEEMTDEQFRQAAKYAKKDTGNKEDFGAIDASAIEANDEVVREANARQAVRDELNKKIYAGRMLSRGDFLRPDGSVSPKAHQFDKDIAKIYSNHAGAFANDYEHFRIIGDNLYSVDQQIAYIIKNTTHNAQADINALNEAAQDEDTRVFAEENIDPNVLNELGTYTITDAFYKYLTSLDTWDGIADDHFEDEMRRIAMDNAA